MERCRLNTALRSLTVEKKKLEIVSLYDPKVKVIVEGKGGKGR